MGRQQFFVKVTDAGLTKRQANRIYENGAQRYANVVSLVTQLNRGFVGEWPAAIGSTAALDDPTANAIQRDQSLATLFGSVDYCSGSECTSVLSPAAYVCDLLLWLRNHPLTGPFPTALAALLDRRPDLGHLLLNCPNTDVPLPYIDLVNELLTFTSAAVASDELHLCAVQANVEDARVRRVGQVQPDDFAEACAQREVRVTGDE